MLHTHIVQRITVLHNGCHKDGFFVWFDASRARATFHLFNVFHPSLLPEQCPCLHKEKELSVQLLLKCKNIRQKAWNTTVSWTTVESSRVLLSAAVPLKECRHQSGRQSAYNLSQIHWPTKSHCSTVLAFLTVTSVNGLFIFFLCFSSFPNPWYFSPSTK